MAALAGQTKVSVGHQSRQPAPASYGESAAHARVPQPSSCVSVSSSAASRSPSFHPPRIQPCSVPIRCSGTFASTLQLSKVTDQTRVPHAHSAHHCNCLEYRCGPCVRTDERAKFGALRTSHRPRSSAARGPRRTSVWRAGLGANAGYSLTGRCGPIAFAGDEQHALSNECRPFPAVPPHDARRSRRRP